MRSKLQAELVDVSTMRDRAQMEADTLRKDFSILTEECHSLKVNHALYFP